MATKSVLGKGLASLLPGAGQTSIPVVNGIPAAPMGTGAMAAGMPMSAAFVQPEVMNKDRHPGISFAMVDDLVANQYQPRRDFIDESLEELAQSIRENGIIQPLVVRKIPQGYELIAGERRLRAAKKAGLKQVPIVIRKSTDRESLELALVENIQRENLNCIDESLAYFQLVNDFQLTQEEVASRVGKNRATVANHLRLLNLPEAIIDDLKRGILTFGHGKALLSSDDNDIRLRARAEVIQKRLSVRDTEALVEQLKRQESGAHQSNAAATAPPLPSHGRLQTVAQDLTRQYSARVEIKGSERRGKIVLHYTTRQELERLLGSLQN